MNLQITHNENHYTVIGILNRQNAGIFQREFKNVFEKYNSLILNIQELKSIDRYGVMVLAQLHNESVSRHKSLSIIGLGCDDLYEEFKSDERAA